MQSISVCLNGNGDGDGPKSGNPGTITREFAQLMSFGGSESSNEVSARWVKG